MAGETRCLEELKGSSFLEFEDQDGYGAGDKRGKDRRDAGRPKTPIINSCPDSIKRRPEEDVQF